MNTCDLCGKQIPANQTFGSFPMDLCWECWHYIKEASSGEVLNFMGMMERTPMREPVVKQVYKTTTRKREMQP